MAGDKRLCFVVGPIGSAGSDTRNHADLLLELIIRPAMAEFPQFHVKRQDEDSKPGMIDSQIIVSLRDADLVIADLSHLNPNAFYEIGIRHMVAKPIVHMQLEDQRIPFDLSLYKTVPFSFVNPAAMRFATDGLSKQVREAIVEGFKPDNPVTRALGQQHFEQTASSEMKVVADQLQSLTTRISALEDGKGNQLAGVVTHPFFFKVMLHKGLSEEESGQIASKILSFIPRASISRTSAELLTVYFQSTQRGALRTMEAIDQIPGVIDCSSPISRRTTEQANLF
ncbi:hypothetical protein FFI89_020185 [Bradyrhizobium sp. KBS0727]|uniref:hypothetical protein n=1 Tax=unclassified Bradyrhizobium TaxID=2631580 RepID=UPI00110D6F8E|nr:MULTISPECIES: hypothetical protein [unclassified Bradyrhizobium]QDW39261.1 hypothetical protein FFI71_020190 [Bradyrhizobium sp. KBS0725]QDW45864.1 hypothetical protein FFI89_020185 [Bradyrhizobium sp. KBS0727]